MQDIETNLFEDISTVKLKNNVINLEQEYIRRRALDNLAIFVSTSLLSYTGINYLSNSFVNGGLYGALEGVIAYVASGVYFFHAARESIESTDMRRRELSIVKSEVKRRFSEAF